MEPVLLLIGVASVAIVIRILAGASDRERIERHFRRRGAEVTDCTWTPFGRGWFGSKSDRIYTVRFRNRDGSLRRATVKTSMFADVYSTAEEEIASRGQEPASPAVTPSAEDLLSENARLRAEIERLRQR